MAKHRLEDKLVPEPELPRQPQAQHTPAPASFQTASAQQTAPARTPIHAPVQTQAPVQQTRAFQAPAPQAPAAPSPPRATHRQERERTGFFSLRRKPADNLYERSFRFCTRCGNEVYVLADGCRHCGDARSLTPEPAL